MAPSRAARYSSPGRSRPVFKETREHEEQQHVSQHVTWQPSAQSFGFKHQRDDRHKAGTYSRHSCAQTDSPCPHTDGSHLSHFPSRLLPQDSRYETSPTHPPATSTPPVWSLSIHLPCTEVTSPTHLTTHPSAPPQLTWPQPQDGSTAVWPIGRALPHQVRQQQQPLTPRRLLCC